MHTHHHPPSQAWHLVAGFTTIELMVTVSILAVLMALAAPSFIPLIESWRVRQATEQLQSTLNYARSEAIKRGGQVAIHKLPNNTNGCTSATDTRDWGCGWIVCHDTNSNGVCNPNEPVLQRIDTPAKVQVSRTGGGVSIKINRWGLVDGTYLGFNLVPLDKSTNHPGARGLCMSSGGRIRVIPPEDIPCTG
ncbi:GspH/FimT family pseudopilin [Simplicispira psychrophila]|uniref:GspH/FimT family pseudopilin n=1 Tax=Simplicispira psychrophila TaxID=80882 RepID=UPI000AB37B56|nr:GspH/FimT family pseudopilin [Simplicispira psychrophila]